MGRVADDITTVEISCKCSNWANPGNLRPRTTGGSSSTRSGVVPTFLSRVCARVCASELPLLLYFLSSVFGCDGVSFRVSFLATLALQIGNNTFLRKTNFFLVLTKVLMNNFVNNIFF